MRTALLDPLKNNPDDPQVKKSIAILDASDRALDQMRAELHLKLGMAPPKAATAPAPVGINLGPYGGAPKTSASSMTAPSNQGYTPIPSVLNK